MEQARSLSERLAAEPLSDEKLIRAAWQQVLGREPDSEEMKLANRFLRRQTENTGGRREAATEMIRGLFNLNEVLYVD